MISPARAAAFKILRALSDGQADLPTSIAAVRAGLADERDRALASEIATGVQRWRAALDHVIVAFSKRDLERLDPEVVDILRLSAYQLLHLTRVPASAVVDDAVNLTRRAGKKSAAGFVNAVLRAVSRGRRSLPLPVRPPDTADREPMLDYLSITLSHPRWLAARWLDRFGFDATEAWLRFDNTAAPVTLRANRLAVSIPVLTERLGVDGVTVRAGRFAPDALIVESGYPLRGADAVSGLFLVQDEASQLIALLAGERPGGRVLDTCAAPGGKTTALAAAMANQGRLVACDLRPRRLNLLRQTVSVSGATNVSLVRANFLHPVPFRAVFDCVLVDAPCSGLGTLRRDPDIRWRRHEGDLAALAAAQLTMLEHAAQAVAPGGRLVYATCSSEPEENEDVASAFLASNPGFASLNASAAAARLPLALVDARGHLRTAPHPQGLEAFFGAVFVRTAASEGGGTNL